MLLSSIKIKSCSVPCNKEHKANCQKMEKTNDPLDKGDEIELDPDEDIILAQKDFEKLSKDLTS